MVNKNKNQYLTGFNDSYNIILQQLINYLFNEKLIKTDKKWTFTKFCIKKILFDYADEVIKGFEYTPENLLQLIDYHDTMKSKFEKILKEIAKENKLKKEEILSNLELDLEEDEEDV